MLVTQSCPTLCHPMDYWWTFAHQVPLSMGFSRQEYGVGFHVESAIPFSRGSSQARDGTWVSLIARRFFTLWVTREGPIVITHPQLLLNPDPIKEPTSLTSLITSTPTWSKCPEDWFHHLASVYLQDQMGVRSHRLRVQPRRTAPPLLQMSSTSKSRLSPGFLTHQL